MTVPAKLLQEAGGATPGPLVQQWARVSRQHMWGATPCIKYRTLGSDQPSKTIYHRDGKIAIFKRTHSPPCARVAQTSGSAEEPGGACRPTPARGGGPCRPQGERAVLGAKGRQIETEAAP